jgi:broad specificity phosphatase PhoE
MPSKKPKAAKVVFHIIRHGDRPTGKVLEGDLSPRGEQQMRVKGKTLANTLAKGRGTAKLVKFYSSTRPRTIRSMELMEESLQKDVGQRKLQVEVLKPRQREKFGYGKVKDPGRFDKLYANMSAAEFDLLWLAGKTDPNIVEQPKETVERIRRATEEFGARISKKYKGMPVEIHVVIVTHGDVIEALREHITKRRIRKRGEITRFGETVKIELRGRKGVYHSRGKKRAFVAKRKR